MQQLIGSRHLFARVRQLRDGLLMEPIGKLTLRPDGSIEGHRHPNEGSWIPYAHGSEPAERAFAFVTANNNWIPSSCWTQSIGDIPTGFFCDEPEVGHSVTQLCLIPEAPLKSVDRTLCLIASCRRFYDTTVPVIVEQLIADGIARDCIKVVVNGCERERDTEVDGISYAFTTHDAWEWSALYVAPLRWQFEYCFLLHDTSVVRPGFKKSIQAVNGHVAWDHLPATPMARCLLGLYSWSFLMRCNEWLKSLDHIDKKNGVIAEAAGELLLRAHSACVIGDPDAGGSAQSAQWRETSDHFRTGAPRVRREFPSVNIDKYIHTGPTNPTCL